MHRPSRHTRDGQACIAQADCAHACCSTSPPAGSHLSDKEVSAGALGDEVRSVGQALGGMARDVAGAMVGGAQEPGQEEGAAGGWGGGGVVLAGAGTHWFDCWVKPTAYNMVSASSDNAAG